MANETYGELWDYMVIPYERTIKVEHGSRSAMRIAVAMQPIWPTTDVLGHSTTSDHAVHNCNWTAMCIDVGAALQPLIILRVDLCIDNSECISLS